MAHDPNPVRIRILSPSKGLFAMGPGKADLLAAIQDIGSIAAAGRKLGLSYQKTRQMVDEMNLCFASPLVEGFKGGAQGGGARLTEAGQEALRRFRTMQARAESAIAEDLAAFRELLAP